MWKPHDYNNFYYVCYPVPACIEIREVVHALLKLNQYLEICRKIKNTFLF